MNPSDARWQIACEKVDGEFSNDWWMGAQWPDGGSPEILAMM